MTESERMLVDALSKIDEGEVLQLTGKLVDEGFDGARIEECLQEGMQTVERRYESGEYFLGDIIVAGTLFVEALKLIPMRSDSDANTESAGKVLVGVVSEDIHDIGKDIVVQVLERHGFTVLDLGIDVPPERYVDAVEQFKPDVATLSGVMGNSPYEMKRIIDMLEERGLRKGMPIIIGGACTSERVCKLVGADAYAKGPIDTMKLCQAYVAQGGCA